MNPTLGTSQDQRPGLRERKKARTRASLREHALRLFRENGYQATTVEKIAEAAEVSVSTFFRYFPTKEDLVRQDDMDTRLIEALERQPAGLGAIAAVRAATRQVIGSYSAADLDVIRQATALTMTVPEVRARAMDEFARTITVVGGPGQARRTPGGRPCRPHRGRRHHVDHAALGRLDGRQRTLEGTFERIEQALALLEDGLPL